MIRGFAVERGRLQSVAAPLEQVPAVVWFDLQNPTDDEEAALEAQLGIDVPTLEEMAEIEDSSRFYLEDGAAFMTAMLPAGFEAGQPSLAPVSFILAGPRLITLRYTEPRPFQSFPQRAEKSDLGCSSGESVLAAVIFLPPTLVASIYGMNFDVMPELHWLFGYPFALGLMVLSAVVSFGVFKARGWL